VDAYIGPGGVLTGTARIAQEAREASEIRMLQGEFDCRKRTLDCKRQALVAQMEALRLEIASTEAERERIGAQEIERKRQSCVIARRWRRRDVSIRCAQGDRRNGNEPGPCPRIREPKQPHPHRRARTRAGTLHPAVVCSRNNASVDLRDSERPQVLRGEPQRPLPTGGDRHLPAATLARDEQIVAAPTLVRHLPLPLRKLVGDCRISSEF